MEKVPRNASFLLTVNRKMVKDEKQTGDCPIPLDSRIPPGEPPKTSWSVAENNDKLTQYAQMEKDARKRAEEINKRVVTLPVRFNPEAQAKLNNCTVDELDEERRKFWNMLEVEDPAAERKKREDELVKQVVGHDVVELMKILESETPNESDDMHQESMSDSEADDTINESGVNENTAPEPIDDLIFPPLPMNLASLDEWVETNRARVSRLFLPILKDL